MTFNIRKADFKAGFWFFQVSGWIGFGIIDALISNFSFIISSLRNFLIWLTSLALSFVISLGLRVYYRFFLRKNPGILTSALLIISGSFMAALLW